MALKDAHNAEVQALKVELEKAWDAVNMASRQHEQFVEGLRQKHAGTDQQVCTVLPSTTVCPQLLFALNYCLP